MDRLPPLTLRETPRFLELILKLFVDEVRLRLDKEACIRCDVCSLVCPKEAVRLLPGDEELDIAIDPRRCVLCEICSHFCPAAAITLTYNGQPKTILTDHQALAPFYPKVDLDPGKCPAPCPPAPAGEEHWCRTQLRLVPNSLTECPKHCQKCLAACPRAAILLDEVSGCTKPAPDQCLRCSQCLTACESGAIIVTPQFRGRVLIEDHKCPPDCLKCINFCPVRIIVRDGPRVFLKAETCSLCGVCQAICDQDAVTLVREEVVALPGEFSHAWDQAVAKLLRQGS